MLAEMGAVLELEAQTPKIEIMQGLEDLMTARRALIKDRTAALARHKTLTSRLLRRQVAARLRQIEGHIHQMDAAVAETVGRDPTLSRKLAKLIVLANALLRDGQTWSEI